MTTDEVSDRLDDLNGALTRSLMSDGSFANALSSILTDLRPLGALIRISVDAKPPSYSTESKVHPVEIRNVAIYQPNDFLTPEDAEAESRPYKDNSVVEFKIEAWWHKSITMPSSTRDKIFRQLSKAIELHWGSRDPLVLMHRLQGPDNQRALNALRSAATDAASVGLVQLDLDDFKKLNKAEFGGYYDLGSAVIQAFASRGRAHFSDIGILLRTGNGDEFSMILAHDDPQEILRQVVKFHDAVSDESFSEITAEDKCTESATKTASIGLVIYNDPSVLLTAVSVEAALSTAGACQERAKQAGKNKIRLPVPDALRETSNSIDGIAILRGAINSRVDLTAPKTDAFKTVAANAAASILAEKAAAMELTAFAELPERLAEKLGLMFCGPNELPSINVVTPWVEKSDWAAVVARAVLQATYSAGALLQQHDDLTFDENTEGVRLTVVRDRQEIAAIKIFNAPTHAVWNEVKIGKPWFSSPCEHEGSLVRRNPPVSSDASVATPGFMSPAILVPIGDTAIDLARSCRLAAAEIIELDDRPVTGGGLPDFWQSNFARIVRAALSNPNIERVLILGNIVSAAETVARLRMPKADQDSALYKLPNRVGIDADSLKSFFQRGLTVQEVPEGEEELLKALLLTALEIKNTNIGDLPVLDFMSESLRAHRLSLSQADDHSRLLSSDGLRARTMADAYPRAIQSLREQDQSIQTEPSGRRFREFTFFKVRFSNATQEAIPDYWLEEEPSLKRYYEDNFLNEERGIFAKRLLHKVDGVSVADAAATEIANAIKQKRPTRRILLPLARVAETLEDVTQPLGLSAIQVLPRLRDGRWQLDFGWIWRTVEALSGFPFSAYGSIMWSQDFLERVRARLKNDGFQYGVEFGELTYMALSFHMFSDIGDMQIARLIVVNAAA